MSVNLKGKTVAITGAGRGIGLAIAQALHKQGAKIAIGDIDTALAQQAAASLGGHGAFLDVRDRSSFTAFLQGAVEALGPIDILINNAGIMPTGAFEQESDAISDTQIDINLRGVIIGCKLAVEMMLAQGGGHIVNVASMAGRLAVPGLAVYCATKFAVVGLTETLREEYRDRHIHFTSILPSKVTTDLSSGTDQAASRIPAVSPDTVAQAVVQALRERQAEVPVPSYLAALNGMQGMAPHWLLRGIRRAFGDQAILKGLDETARAGYNQRINQLLPHASNRRKLR